MTTNRPKTAGWRPNAPIPTVATTPVRVLGAAGCRSMADSVIARAVVVVARRSAARTAGHRGT
jgi:hypothetical protein